MHRSISSGGAGLLRSRRRMVERLARVGVTDARVSEALAAVPRHALDRLGVTHVVVHLGDGSAGRPADAPFDAIAVTAAALEVPRPLLEQLAPGGRLVGPFGDRREQTLLRVRRTPAGRFERECLGHCRFVDLVGRHGWAA